MLGVRARFRFTDTHALSQDQHLRVTGCRATLYGPTANQALTVCVCACVCARVCVRVCARVCVCVYRVWCIVYSYRVCMYVYVNRR